jgi:DNA ligase (NAD+)
VGESAGSKETKARELGLRILDEAGFVALLAQGPAGVGDAPAADDTAGDDVPDDAGDHAAAEAGA